MGAKLIGRNHDGRFTYLSNPRVWKVGHGRPVPLNVRALRRDTPSVPRNPFALKPSEAPRRAPLFRVLSRIE